MVSGDALRQTEAGGKLAEKLELVKPAPRPKFSTIQPKPFIPEVVPDLAQGVNQEIQQALSGSDYDKALRLSRELRRDVGLGLRQSERRILLEALDEDGGKIVVFSMPGEFGKTPTMRGLCSQVGGVCVDSYDDMNITDFNSKYDRHQREIRDGALFCWDEFQNLRDGEYVAIAKNIHSKGKGVIMAVRPYGYLLSNFERMVSDDPMFKEIQCGALSRDDERRIVDGMGLDENTGNKLMHYAGGHPQPYKVLFRNVLDMREVERMLTALDTLAGGKYADPPLSVPLDRYRKQDGVTTYYEGTLEAVRKIRSGGAGRLSEHERQLALGSQMALEREGELYVPPFVELILDLYDQPPIRARMVGMKIETAKREHDIKTICGIAKLDPRSIHYVRIRETG